MRTRATRLADRIHGWDEVTFDRTAAFRASAADPVLRALTKSANHSVLWGVAAGALAVRPGRTRRAAVRGMLAVAGASAVANGLLKPLFPRTRPGTELTPFVRRLISPPRSSSFPSGHSASAAAFVTAVALESPAAGAVLAPVAAAVCYSRVHTGVHWPSDVVAGAALGTALALSTRRWWAVRTDEPAEVRADRDAPSLPHGHGLLVLVNRSSGSDDAVTDEIRALLPEAELFEPDPDLDFGDQLEKQIAQSSPRALGVCGGDGTVVSVAESAVRHDLPFVVFPGGTLNHFAKDAGVDDVSSTATAVENGLASVVDVASVRVDETQVIPFVNTATFGGYPDSVRMRERLQGRIGKWPAAAVAMVRVLAAARPLDVTIDGRKHAVWMLFVGNGQYSPADQVPMSRRSIGSGTLDVRYLPSKPFLSRTRLVFAAATGTLGSSSTYVHRVAQSLKVEVDGPQVALATDGEVTADGRVFEFANDTGVVLYRDR
ncbi:bifunctional phosphatase PAP2/diacylglycerol kinase family protein [Rhodococcoides kyotonense]|uniref:Undecaprenyl-diphosphatase n=1 Tax=Rhodococcoides kyotonense TaxID=398843 RepID=A0A239CK21_9NOCA|nr:bifunctional phosphatase PAP2/diacylglycerol kinase family protein [Rhodococcus kyotonensis]SNS20242.1 undecaprenyl-diphosphatase [Rhodococcus kyotonensis]